jgi:hypothetical protein
MSVSTTEPPQFDVAGDGAYTAGPALRPLTEAQERALYAFAVQAQRSLRLEVSWSGSMMQVRLVSSVEKRSV